MAHDCWRINDGDQGYLVSEIKINVPSYTSKNEITGFGVKYHITCSGILEIIELCLFSLLKKMRYLTPKKLRLLLELKPSI